MRTNSRLVWAAAAMLAAGACMAGPAFAEDSASGSDAGSYKQQIEALRDQAEARVQAEIQTMREQLRGQIQTELATLGQQVNADVVAALATVQQEIRALPQGGGAAPPPSHFKVTSSGYSEGSMIPTQYSCAVPNGTNAGYSWSDPPAGTMSYAAILHDLDGAPGKNSMDVTHWILWDIAGSQTSLSADIKPNSMPGGLEQGKNVRNIQGYQPPCPPPGATAHHYVFELYALDVPKLDLPAGATRDQLLMAMNGHVIGKATLVALFGR